MFHGRLNGTIPMSEMMAISPLLLSKNHPLDDWRRGLREAKVPDGRHFRVLRQEGSFRCFPQGRRLFFEQQTRAPYVGGLRSYSCAGLRVHVFLEYVTVYVLNFERAPGPSGDRGEMAMADGRCGAACALRSTTDTVPWSLCSYSPRSSWPQPLGGGGDATPCEDTREERGLFFNFLPPRVVTVWLSSVTRLAPGRAKSQVPQTHKDCCGFGGHGSAPGGALNQRGVTTRKLQVHRRGVTTRKQQVHQKREARA